MAQNPPYPIWDRNRGSLAVSPIKNVDCCESDPSASILKRPSREKLKYDCLLARRALGGCVSSP